MYTLWTQRKNGCQINIPLFLKLKLARLASLEIMYSFEFCMKNEASHANFNLNNLAVIFAFGL